MSEFQSFPKPTRRRSKQAIEEQRKDRCEICGGTAAGLPHHIVPVGAGGPDRAENLIQLCRQHHTDAHNGHLSQDECWEVVARREGLTMSHVRALCLDDRRRAHVGEWNG